MKEDDCPPRCAPGEGPAPTKEEVNQQATANANQVIALFGVAELGWSALRYGVAKVGAALGGGARAAPAARAADDAIISSLEREGNIVTFEAQVGKSSIQVMAEMSQEGSSLFLRGAEIGGAGRGSAGFSVFGRAANALGREWGVKEVIVEGAKRTTGSRPGHIPKPFVFPVQPW